MTLVTGEKISEQLKKFFVFECKFLLAFYSSSEPDDEEEDDDASSLLLLGIIGCWN